MTSWTLVLPYSVPPLSLNQRMHWAPKSRWVRQIRGDANLLARGARLPKGLARIEVILHWTPSVRRPRDQDNPTPTLKAAIDGLRDYGLIEDDDSTRVTSGCVVEALAPVARVWLTVTDLSDGAA